MKGCKNLDYDESHYPRCKLKSLDDQGFPGVKYWDRFEGGLITAEEISKFPNTPIKVQFCGLGRGRINGIFQCYNLGEMYCYEEEPEKKEPDYEQISKNS